MGGIGIEKTAAVCADLFDGFLRSDRPYGNGLPAGVDCLRGYGTA